MTLMFATIEVLAARFCDEVTVLNPETKKLENRTVDFLMPVAVVLFHHPNGHVEGVAYRMFPEVE